MTDAVAQLIAGGILIGVAAVAAFIAYRLGRRHGIREALQMSDAERQAYQEEEAAARQEQRPPRPPEPPTVVH